MIINLFDDERREAFLPLSFTKPLGKLLSGLWTIEDRWKNYGAEAVGFNTADHLSQVYLPLDSHEALSVNARYQPNDALISAIVKLKEGQALFCNSELVAIHSHLYADKSTVNEKVDLMFSGVVFNSPTDLFTQCDELIRSDFTKLQTSQHSVPSEITVVGDPKMIFIDEGAVVRPCIINTESGPVYIGKDSEVMEGCLIRGPFVLGEHSTLKMGAKIYGATSIGKHCKIGGEVSNSIVHDYSNKAHDGFIGNSVLGSWCNLGADTNTSNLKNNYGGVRVWEYSSNGYRDSGLTFCGLVMGDHSKSAINTQFNTGTVVGVNANVFGHGFPPKFIPDFSWGGSDGFPEYEFDKAMEVAERVYARRGMNLSDEEVSVLRHIFDTTSNYRN